MPRVNPIRVKAREEGSDGAKRRFIIELEGERTLFLEADMLTRRKAIPSLIKALKKGTEEALKEYLTEAERILKRAVELTHTNPKQGGRAPS